MARRLLLGRAGTGKTHACVERLSAAVRADRAALLLVPTYGQAEHLRARLLDRGEGLGRYPIATFSSLAERALGLPLRRLVTAALRDRVAAEVLETHFPEAAAQAGFRGQFLAAVKEIKEQGQAVAEVLERVRAHFPDETCRERRLFAAYADYQEALPGPDHEDLLLRARDHLRDSPLVLDLLLVDGFHDFTAVERQILDLLAAAAAETVVTLPLDPHDEGHPIFRTAARTARSLTGFARVELAHNHRAPGVLGELEHRLFGDPRQPARGAGLEVLACASDEDEADRIARLVVASGRPYQDFLLVRRDFDGLHDLYRAAFARYGVPLRFFGAEPLGHIPAARATRIWLRHLAGAVPLPELLPLLRSAYLLEGPAAEEVDGLAARLRERGAVDDLTEFPGISRALDRGHGSLRARLAGRLGVRDILATLAEGDFEIARAHRFFCQLQEEAGALEGWPAERAAEHLLRRVPGLRATVPDRRHACVYAVEALEARQWEIPVAIVAGLGSESFPRQHTQDLFLRDEQRRELAEVRGLQLPLRSRREDEERYLFYVALTRARERLVLTYAAFDEEGTPRAASPYLEEALAHLQGVARREIALAEQYPQPRDVICEQDLLPIVADGLARADRGEGALAAALYERGAVPRALLAAPRRLELARSRPVRLPRTTAERALSPSGINDYLRCPYLFFARRILGVEPAREQALDPLVRGSIVHAALERCAREPGRDAGELFDAVFADGTRGFRLGLDGEAARRWMRAAVLDAAAAMRGSRVQDVERSFRIEVGAFQLTGRIDRVDRLDGGELVRDYKTGEPALRAAQDLEDVQLDAYLLAVERPVGAVYERLRKRDRVGYLLEGIAGEEFEGRGIERLGEAQLRARQQRVRALVEQVGARIRAGRLALHPRDPERCTRTDCSAYDLCRVARARWLARAAREAGR